MGQINITELRARKPKFYVLQVGLHFTHLPSSPPAHQRQRCTFRLISKCTCGTNITRALFLLRGREELDAQAFPLLHSPLPSSEQLQVSFNLTFSSTALGSFTPTSSPLSSARLLLVCCPSHDGQAFWSFPSAGHKETRGCFSQSCT